MKLPPISSTIAATSARLPPTRAITASAIAARSWLYVRTSVIREHPAKARGEQQVGHADADLQVEREAAEAEDEHHGLVGRQEWAEEWDREGFGEAGTARRRREVREHQVDDHRGERTHADLATERVDQRDA